MKKLLFLLLGTILLTGCTPMASNEGSTATETEYEGEGKVTEEIDWSQAAEEATDYFTEEFEEITYALEFDASIDPDTKQITLFALVSDDTAAEDALEYANTVVRSFNDIFVHNQDNEIALSSEDSYGGIYEEFSVSIGIAPKSQKADESQWFVKEDIPAGEYKTFKLQNTN